MGYSCIIVKMFAFLYSGVLIKDPCF